MSGEESSELDQKLLHEQASDQDFSEDEKQSNENDGAFEEGSEDMNMITVTNPILFTEHVAVMGRVPLSKYQTSQARTILTLISFACSVLLA